MNAGPEPLNSATQKNLLKGAFPCFAQQAVEVLGLLFIGSLMAVAKVLIGSLPLVLEVSDLLFYRKCDPRQFFGAYTRALGELPDMLVKLFNAQFFGKLLEEKEEDDIVREDDDLPGPCFLHQPPRHALTPFVVK